MSGNTGQIIGGVIGAAVGFWFGMPGLGWTLGSALGGAVAGPDGPSPDPGDLSFNTSAYGKFRPFGYGTHPITPVCFWTTDWVAHEHSEGGKGGGPEQTTLTYTRSAAFYLRDCTDGSEIVGIRSIKNKMTGEVLYYVGDDADAETILASAKFASGLRVYTGTVDQEPDSLIESHEGWAPAHRGHAYVVIEDMDHGQTKQAIPLEVEVITAGTEAAPSLLAQHDVEGPTMTYTASAYYQDQESGQVIIFKNIDGLGAGNTTRVYGVMPNGSFELRSEFEAPTSGASLDGWADQAVAAIAGSGRVYICDEFGGLVHECVLSLIGTAEQQAQYYQRGSRKYILREWAGTSTTTNVYDATPATATLVYSSTHSTPTGQLHTMFIGSSMLYGFTMSEQFVAFDFDWNVLWSVDMSGAIGLSGGTSAVGGNDVIIREISDGVALLYQARDFWIVDESGYKYLGFVSGMASSYEEHGGHLLIGDLFAVFSASSDKIDWVRISALTGQAATLPDVIENLCQRAEFEPGQYDTSALPSTDVRMHINAKRPARDWLAQLAQVYGFRMRDSAGVLQFIPKGGTSVATIPQDDLGMGAGEGAVPLQYGRVEGIDLPRSVTVTYSDAANDYLPGTQIFRMQGYPQGSDVSLNLSNHIMTAEQALALAEIACKEPHLQRMSWDTMLGQKWEALEPGDVVDLPVGLAWVRQIGRNKGRMSVSLVAEAAAVTTSSGLPGALAPVTPRRIGLVGPTRLELIDAPAITDSHTGPGYLVAASGYLSGWSGAAVYVSRDGGETYDRLLEITEAATLGTAETALADGEPNGWDRSGSVTVRLTTPDATLASEALDNVLNGANAAILGDEVIKFASVEYLGENRYTLSMLQRGRKGTERATGTHAIGERFVLLNTAVQRLTMDIDNLNAERLYKAVSYGNLLSNASALSFTPAGVSLKPWPPAGARAYKSGTSWIIKCLERTRFGGELRNYVGITRDPEWDGWDLEILDGPGGAVVRTVSALTSPTYTYTFAMQTTDFGSAQSSIHFVWYQRSTVIGRGYPTEASA